MTAMATIAMLTTTTAFISIVFASVAIIITVVNNQHGLFALSMASILRILLLNKDKKSCDIYTQ
jgi:hypothetical protein